MVFILVKRFTKVQNYGRGVKDGSPLAKHAWTGRFCRHIFLVFVCFWCDSLQWAWASSFTRFLDHTQRRTTVGRTPLEEWSAPCRDLYLTTHNTHNRQTSMLPSGLEPTISAGERTQTYALERAATGTGHIFLVLLEN